MGCSQQHRLPFFVTYQTCRRYPACKTFPACRSYILFQLLFLHLYHPGFFKFSPNFIMLLVWIYFQFLVYIQCCCVQARAFLSKLGELNQTQIFAKIENIEVRCLNGQLLTAVVHLRLDLVLNMKPCLCQFLVGVNSLWWDLTRSRWNYSFSGKFGDRSPNREG